MNKVTIAGSFPNQEQLEEFKEGFEVKHTPTPWVRTSPIYRDGEGIWHCSITANGYPLATLNGRTAEEVEANAAFIIKACDEHEELLEIARLGKLYYGSRGSVDANKARHDFRRSVEAYEEKHGELDDMKGGAA